MKKYLIMMMVFVLILTACSKDSQEESDNSKAAETTTEVVTKQTSVQKDNEIESDVETSDPEAAIAFEHEKLRKQGVEWVELFVQGDYETMISEYNMSAELKAVLTVEMLTQLSVDLNSQIGAYKQVLGSKYVEDKGYGIVFVNIEHEKSKLSLLVVYDDVGAISGFNTVPVDETDIIPYEMTDSEEHEDEVQSDDEYIEQEVTFGRPDYMLEGVLIAPTDVELNTVIVIIHGSGPSDRDGSMGPNTPYKDIAIDLSKEGIGSLRFDKRTLTYGNDVSGDMRFTLYDESVEDAYLATKFLKETLGDEVKVVILGHSLGGHLIPYIHDTIEENGLNAFKYIIMAGNARNIIQILPEQIDYLINLDGEVSADEEIVMTQYEEGFELLDNIDALDNEDIVLGAYKNYWKSIEDYKPLDSVVTIDEPILVLQGSRDYQVTPEEFERWMEAMSTMDNVTFKMIEGVNHLMIHGEGEPNNMEYMIPSHVDTSVVEEIVSFIKE